jgi:hypothetical protein
MSIKGYQGKDTEGAKGGPGLGRTRNFLKETDGPDQRGFGKIPDDGFVNKDVPWQEYHKTGTTGELSKPTGDKKLKTVKPRK